MPSDAPTDHPSLLLVPGRTCWRTARARRAALLIDGQAYYARLREALIRARSSVLILAWDIDSRLELVRGSVDDGLPTRLGELLYALAEERPALDIRILEWDWAVIYAMEREWWPLFSRPEWRRHDRLHFRLDGRHAVGASHHQKVVVIDDRVAFVGGMDASKWRWDRPAHEAGDPGRVDPDGQHYPPYHDVQMIVDGPAAAALGDLARERWRVACDEELPRPDAGDADPWPPGLPPDLSDVDVGISRTLAAWGGVGDVREVERLWLDAIASARRSIYIENQYLTAASVCEALCARLAEEDGPEIVIVLPRTRTGWLERHLMGVLRSRCLRSLRAADRNGRLGVYSPHVPGLEQQIMNIHAKLLVVDDRLLRVGSSNLSNRSMGLDSECDLAIEAGDREDVREAIADIRWRLAAHQLGVDAATVRDAHESGDELLPRIEALGADHRRGLQPLDGLVDERLEQALPRSVVVDPERPVDPRQLVEELVPSEQDGVSARRRLRVTTAVVAMLALAAAAWRWTPLNEWLDAQRVADWLHARPDGFATMALVVGGFVAGSLIALPISFMVVVTSLVFDAPRAFACAWLGGTLGALATFGLGRLLGRETVRRLAGRRLNRLSRLIAERGLLTVITLRIVPVAPFIVVNMVMGASHVRTSQFVLGTVIGLVPGMAAIAVFVERLVVAVREADATNIALAVAVGGAALAGVLLLQRWLAGRRPAS